MLYVLGMLSTDDQLTLRLTLGMPSPLLAVPDELVQSALVALFVLVADRGGQSLTHSR